VSFAQFVVLHVSFKEIASFQEFRPGRKLAFCDRVILCDRAYGGRIVWREIGVPAEFIYLQQVYYTVGLKLIGNVSQNILLTVGVLHILFVSKKNKMRRKRLTPPSIDLLVLFIKCMLIWTEG
jgi:hypothetical protein